MQIKNISINGFGIFHDHQFSNFKSGINVIYGPNEFGKTTLLEFIRGVLFGFPTKSAKNYYPALSGGTVGGSLSCILSNNEEFTVHRTEAPNGGKVTVYVGSDEFNGKEELVNRIGIVSRTFYENVYAISLDELQHASSLQKDEIKSRIYGAGLGLGKVSLSDIKSGILKKKESIFRSGGSAQILPKRLKSITDLEGEIRNIQSNLDEYDFLLERKAELNENIHELDEKQKSELEQQSILTHMQNLYPKYSRMQSITDKLSKLENVPESILAAGEKLEQLNRKVETLNEKIDENKIEYDELKIEIDRIEVVGKLLEQEGEINYLQKQSARYETDTGELEELKKSKDNLSQNIDGAIGKLGDNWNYKKVEEFKLSHKDEDSVQSLGGKINDIHGKIADCQNKIDIHTEQQSSGSTKQLNSPRLVRILVYLLTGLGLIGSIIGFMNSITSLAVIGLAIVLIGVPISYMIRQDGALKATDKYVDNMNQTLEEANMEKDDALGKWKTLLLKLEMAPDSSVEYVSGLIDHINVVKTDIADLQELTDKIGEFTNFLESIKIRHDKVLSALDKSLYTENIVANIDLFFQQLSSSMTNKTILEEKLLQIEKLKGKTKTWQKDTTKIVKEVKSLIKKNKCKDEDEFDRKIEVYHERTDLEEEQDDIEENIQSAVGSGEYYSSFMTKISKTNPPKIESELKISEQYLIEIKENQNSMLTEIGELNTIIDQLSSSDELLEKQHEIELIKEQLRDDALIWTKHAIELAVLDQAVSIYEKTRQPAVVKEAGKMISEITDKRYKEVVQLAETGEVVLVDGVGNRKKTSAMSRGTKEELFLAMRLGLIQEYEKHEESLPVVIDDTLVNFDDDRIKSTIKILNDFAKSRQVIVFTCHQAILNIFKKYKVNQIITS